MMGQGPYLFRNTMQTLTIYQQLTVTTLMKKYELLIHTLDRLHEELANLQSTIHITYLQRYITSPGKSVAEKNRDADQETMLMYKDIIELRGRVNRLSEQRDMFMNLINWKLRISSSVKPQLSNTYPPNNDKEMIGRGQ